MTNGVVTVPLTAQQLARLRGSHSTRWLTFLNPNTQMFSARVNQAVFASSFIEIAYDTVTTGTYTDVREGWTVYLSRTSDIRDSYFRGRVQSEPTNSSIFVNWTSAAVQDNDYIFVAKDSALHEKLPRKTGGVIYFDYNKAFRQLLPVVKNLPTAAAGKLQPGGHVDFTFNPLVILGTSGASVSTWAWDSDGGSFQSGSSSSQNVTIRFSSAGWYEVRLTVTDNGGRVNYFTIRTIVYPADYSSIVSRDILCKSVTNDIKSGWTAQFEVAEGTDMDNVLRQNEVVVVAEDVFTTRLVGALGNGSAVVTGLSSTTALSAGMKARGRGIPAGTTIASVDSSSQVTLSANATRTGPNKLDFVSEESLLSNIKFVGRIREDQDDTALHPQQARIKNRSFEADGMAAQLGRLILATVALRRRASPAEMGEIKDLTLWRAILFLLTELTTFSTISAIDFDSTSDDFTIPLVGTQDSSAADNVSEVAFAINMMFNWSPTGAVMFARHTHYQSDKSGVVTVAGWQPRDYKQRFQVRRQHVEPMGRVIGYAGSFNTTSEKTLVLRAKAPAEIWGPGEGRGQFNRQVLAANLSLAAAQNEIGYRTGAEYASKNLMYTITTTHRSGYDNVVNCSVYQRHTWDEGGFDSSKYWLCQRVQISYDDQNYTTSTGTTYIEDIAGINAQIIAEIAPDDLPAPTPDLSPWDDSIFGGLPGMSFPDGADVPPEDEQPYSPTEAARARTPTGRSTDPTRPGPSPAQDPAAAEASVVLTGNTAGVWIAEDTARRRSPTWNNITPGTGVQHGIFSRHDARGWVLTQDGADSIVWRKDNLRSISSPWNSVRLSDELYTQIRNAAVPGQLYVYGTGIGNPDLTFDFTGSQAAGWNAYFNGLNHQAQVSSAGWVPNVFPSRISIYYDFGVDKDLTTIDVSRTMDGTGNTQTQTFYIESSPGSGSFDTLVSTETDVMSVTHTLNITASRILLDVVSDFSTGGTLVPGAVDGIIVHFDGSGGEDSVTRYSSDNGATFAPLVAVGDGVTDGGFDAMPGSADVLAAADEQVRTATTGGSYSDASGGDISGSYPAAIWGYGEDGDFLMASAAAVGGETLWKVVGGVKTAITPNDGSNDGLIVGPGALCTAPDDDDTIYAVMSFGGTIKLARSADGGTTWAFTTGLDNNACWVRAKNALQLWIANRDSLLYSEDGGVTLVSRTAPGPSLLFVEVA